VIYFGEVGVLYIFELVDLRELPVEFVHIVDIVLFMVHEVFVGRLFETVDVGLPEKGVFELLEKFDFIKYVGTN